MNKKFDFTSDEFLGIGHGNEENIEIYEDDPITEEFIKETCEAIVKNESEGFPVVVNIGTLLFFLVFEKDKGLNQPDPDGELIDAYAAVNLLGEEWVMMPGIVADWIVELFLETVEDFSQLFQQYDGEDMPF